MKLFGSLPQTLESLGLFRHFGDSSSSLGENPLDFCPHVRVAQLPRQLLLLLCHTEPNILMGHVRVAFKRFFLPVF